MTTYFYKPVANKSATMRTKKVDFLKSPYAKSVKQSADKKGFSMGSRFVGKKVEEL